MPSKRPAPKAPPPPKPPPAEVPASVPLGTDPGVAADPQEVFDRSVSEYESDARREGGEPRPQLSHPPDLPEEPPKDRRPGKKPKR